MKILPNFIQKKIAVYRYNQEQNLLNFAHIDNKTLDADVLQLLYPARKGIAQYASHEGMSVEISGAEKLFESVEHDSAMLTKAQEENKDKILVKVTDLLFNKTRSAIVSGNTAQIHTYKFADRNDPIRRTYIVVHDPTEDQQITQLTPHEYEDNFLRNIYRNIENLTKELHNSKK